MIRVLSTIKCNLASEFYGSSCAPVTARTHTHNTSELKCMSTASNSLCTVRSTLYHRRLQNETREQITRASDWSVLRICPRFLRLIGPS
eukprot:9179371-Pyramimonas_sp.AAC.1